MSGVPSAPEMGCNPKPSLPTIAYLNVPSHMRGTHTSGEYDLSRPAPSASHPSACEALQLALPVTKYGL